MTSAEQSLVSQLRQKMGDNPTRVVALADVDTTVFIDNVEVVCTGTDVGRICLDVAKTVWDTSEYLTIINSARVQLFKNKVDNVNNLTEFELECVLLKSRILLLHDLSVNSTKYARYSVHSTSYEKTPAEQYLRIAQSLESYLTNMISEGDGGSSDISVKTVTEGVILRYDRTRGITVPTKFDTDPPLPAINLENLATGIQVQLRRVFISDFSYGFIKKGVSPNEGDIIFTFENLKDYKILDEVVTENTIYRYTVFIQDIMGNINSRSKDIARVTPT